MFLNSSKLKFPSLNLVLNSYFFFKYCSKIFRYDVAKPRKTCSSTSNKTQNSFELLINNNTHEGVTSTKSKWKSCVKISYNNEEFFVLSSFYGGTPEDTEYLLLTFHETGWDIRFCLKLTTAIVMKANNLGVRILHNKA